MALPKCLFIRHCQRSREVSQILGPPGSGYFHRGPLKCRYLAFEYLRYPCLQVVFSHCPPLGEKEILNVDLGTQLFDALPMNLEALAKR